MRRLLTGLTLATSLACAAPVHASEPAHPTLPPLHEVSIGEPVFDIFDRTHGLQSTQLFDVYSDPNGFVWLAGDRGIHRFDGHTFFDLDRDPDRTDTLDSRFNYLVAPSRQAVWIVAPSATVQVFDSNTGKLTRLATHGASLKDIEWLQADAGGRLWYLNPEGVVRLDRSGTATRVVSPALGAAFSRDRMKLFVVSADRVTAIDTADPSRTSTALVLPKQFQGPIVRMTADADGLWAVVDHGLWRFDLTAGSAQYVEMPFPMSLIAGVVRANDGKLWFGGYDGVLYRYDPATGGLSTLRNNPNDPQSLPPSPIVGMTLDRSNNLWLAQGGAGLARLRLNQTSPSHYRLKGGSRICSLGEIDPRRLVMGLCPGGVVEVDRKTGQQRPLPAAIALPDRSRAIASDKQGGLWITSLREGLIHWRPDGSAERYFLKGRENRHLLMSGIHVDAQGRVWVSHLRGLSLLDREAGELRSVGGDRFYIVNDVSGGPKGSLWLGTVNGLVNFRPETEQLRRYEHDPNDRTTLSDNDVVQAYTDPHGALWVGTRAGLNRLVAFRDGRPVFKRYGLADGLPDITISAIANDAQGALWVGTYRGIARWNAQTDRFQSYLPADGIPDSDVYAKAMLSSADGHLYLGTWSGLWRVDPKTIHLAEPVPVVLSSYEVGDHTTVNLRGKALSRIEAKYSDNRIAFHIAVLGDARRLSYRLAGLEDQWREMPGDLSISYHSLPPGAYHLQIRQLQRDGSWGAPELSLPIRITPPFWRTTWAYLVYALIGIALLAAVARTFMAWRHRVLREQLKESHAKLSVALHAARFGIWAWDVGTDEAEFDPYTRELLATSTNAPPMADVFARVHPDDIGNIRAQMERALRDDEAIDFEFRLATDDSRSQWRWIEGHAVPYRAPGKSAYVIGVNRDATQRKRELLELEESKRAAENALEELKRSRQDLALALESGALGVWRSELFPLAPAIPPKWTRDLPLDCDANVHRIFGWYRGAATRRDFLRALHRDDRRRVLEKLTGVLAHGGSYADQYRIVHPDGEERCISVRAVPALHASPSAEPARGMLTGIVHDVTGEEALKADLQRTAAEAQLATEAKGRFLAMMSHEIRTPINGVLGMVELLFESPMGEEQRQLLGICRDSAYMLLTIINDILDFSKIEAGKLKLEVAPLSPRRLVESVTDALRVQAAQKGIDLDIFIDRQVPRRVLGDRVRLRQVLNNLIGNAIKFTEQGGVRIHVRVAGESDGRHLLRFDVVDTGVGMDRRTLDILFQPFQQADEATTRRFGGTGLGLSIVRHLVSLMGGTIECDSKLASGSRFSVTVPLRAIDAEAKQRWLPDLRIIALCGSTERGNLLRELAADLGMSIEIHAALDPALERLRAAADTAPPLALIDKSFAEEHTAFCDAIRRDARTARAPIVLVRADDRRTTTAHENGIAVVAGSPLTAAGLARGIQSALGLAPLPAPTAATETPTDAPAPSAEAAILLAEDNATNREVIVRQLQRLGQACDVAENGEQAWAMLLAHPHRYRLLLTDCHMPRLDGYGLTERIRDHEAVSGDAHLNIVAITANALLGEGERCLALGMDAFLTKPVQISDLQKMLVRMLPTDALPAMPVGAEAAIPAPDDAGPSMLAGMDDARRLRLLGIFVNSTRTDLDHWKRARLAGDHASLRMLAHKLKSGCRQLGENAVAHTLEAVERHAGAADALEALADRAHLQLEQVLERIVASDARLQVGIDAIRPRP